MGKWWASLHTCVYRAWHFVQSNFLHIAWTSCFKKICNGPGFDVFLSIWLVINFLYLVYADVYSLRDAELLWLWYWFTPKTKCKYMIFLPLLLSPSFLDSGYLIWHLLLYKCLLRCHHLYQEGLFGNNICSFKRREEKLGAPHICGASHSLLSR